MFERFAEKMFYVVFAIGMICFSLMMIALVISMFVGIFGGI